MSVRHNPGATPASLAAGITQTTVATPGTSLTSATTANVTSKSLPAGTYLVWGNVDFLLATATVTSFSAGLSLTSATLPTQAGGGGLGPDALSTIPLSVTLLSTGITLHVAPTVLTLASTTALYLVAQCSFVLGTVSAFGTLNALPLN